MSDVIVDLDDFGRSLEQLLNNVDKSVTKECVHAVREGGKTAKKEIRANALKSFKSRDNMYANSWRMRVKKQYGEVGATVYSTVPGLPHLLELGHVSKSRNGMIVGFVDGVSHIKPAAEDAFDVTTDLLDAGVEKALEESHF